MAADLAGRIALVSGVTRVGQIGPAIAAALGAAGARLVLAGRHLEALEERQRDFSAAGVVTEVAPGDLSDPAVARAAVAMAESRFGGLDIVVNVAGGLTSYGPYEQAGAEVLDRELAMNLRTVYSVCQAAVPALRRRGGGSILNFASIAVLYPQPNLAAYTAAKGGVAALTRALARELRDAGIRVNALAPQAVRTASNETSMGPEARLVEMSDLVRAVCWLVSDGAKALTGQVVPLLAEGRAR